ncbi:MAG: dihydroorotate dehydrogenase [Actinobacteria bacterium]|nr:dihydroorotate dehydrogenase [Actinomycetota bacterium]
MPPLLNASGCLDALAAPDVARSLDAFVTKTVTPLPRDGNAPVRIAEIDCGMLNTIGLANPGLDDFVCDTLPRLLELGVPVWVSVGGFRAGDYAESCARLDDEGVEAIELNVSCPNVESPVEATEEIVAAARAATAKPLFTKLSPQLPDVAAVALAAARAGTDGLSLVNTLRGLALDPRTLAPVLSTATGGVSGPVLRPVALAAVHACYAATGLPIVGMGGVETGRHALDLIAAGASACALGTILFRDPDAPARVRAELARTAFRLGLEDPLAARGLAHREAEMPLPSETKIPAKVD